ncbi:hypothetical protein [Actinoplanes sp. L3-i22]|uniref:hypothetical protein n=1 Tax=Actinoplanes sp. L3-i22 TaxID=2836373 RepID=UPI001C74D7E5|nr:hypothetical protein [Actinoplanes sp. L3-i22]BCY13019.1 hypothetical protein L3i22_081070 [Actinoplanes sp. L3-i22]
MFGRRLELDATVVAIATDVVTENYPDEIGMLAEIRTPPRAYRLRAPVGMGVELAAVTPVLLSALTFVAGAAATPLIEGLSTAAGERLARVFRPAPEPVPATAEPDWSEIIALLAALLIERGMRPDLAGQVAAQAVEAMRRRDGQAG